MTADTFRKIEAHLFQSAEVKRQTAASCARSIAKAAAVIAEAFLYGRKLLLCGNGGSAADCQHMAAELVSRFSKDLDRRALPAIALTTDTSFLTAFGTTVASKESLSGKSGFRVPGDLLIGISTSGNSPTLSGR
jgi:D-sedoheptulose 7-phosphate isomerase